MWTWRCCGPCSEAQLQSRHLDLAQRWLQSQGQGFYTIGSAGHEGNAAVAPALRPTDPALLHYRSGGFYLRPGGAAAGSRRRSGDILLGVAAATAEPIAGGRHKVFGKHDLAVIPQTSTIASHLPRAIGVAFSIARAAELGVPSPWPADAIVVTSFGDASANHSTATGAINAAGTRRTRAADAVAAGLRGQRDRDQRADPGRLDPAGATRTAPAPAT